MASRLAFAGAECVSTEVCSSVTRRMLAASRSFPAQVGIVAGDPVVATRREEVQIVRVLERFGRVRDPRGDDQHVADLLAVVGMRRDDRATRKPDLRQRAALAGEEPALDSFHHLFARRVIEAMQSCGGLVRHGYLPGWRY